MAVTTAEKPRSRSKLTKALVATGVGVALLAGGGGTFAKWYDSTTALTETQISSGALSLGAGTDTGTWWSGQEVINPRNYFIVPGETLTFTQDVVVAAKGDRLTATLFADFSKLLPAATDANRALLEQLQADAVFKIGDDKVSTAKGVPVKATATPQTYQVELAITFRDLPDQRTLGQNQTVTLTNQIIQLQQGELK